MKNKPMPPLNVIKHFLHYDNTTGIFYQKISRCNVEAGDVAGRIANTGYWQIRVNGIHYQGHRLAYYYVTGIDPLENEIDHISGNRSDNRFENLRLATKSQNHFNVGKYKSNTSGYKGVYFDKTHNKYRAEIVVNGKRTRLGRYKTAEEAHEAYCHAAALYHGDFKNLN